VSRQANWAVDGMIEQASLGNQPSENVRSSDEGIVNKKRKEKKLSLHLHVK
jgi:hypothetical protein